MINIMVSPGELIDKITILKLKKKFITDNTQSKNINIELNILLPILNENNLNTGEIKILSDELYYINNKLWEIEDDIREKERLSDFGEEFIKLARDVYFTNDKRSAIKKKINILAGSKIIEEKSYSDY
tara:strand:- start:3241 stop:3624 length:384 start_codon:yes stop_codon:yes gene_type:complete